MIHRLALAALALAGLAASAATGPGPIRIVVFESPSPALIHELADSDLDVRWEESGLVVAEQSGDAALPRGGRQVATRQTDQALALLRAGERGRDEHEKAFAALGGARVAEAGASAGRVWLFLGAPESWPAELLGCHGPLVLPKHHLDPSSLLDLGPPAALLPWVQAPRRPSSGAQRALAAVSTDSLFAYLQMLTHDARGFPANRHVFAAELDALHVPRLEAVMARAVAGIAGAAVRREAFTKSRRCSGRTVVDSTYNVIARLPGSVPGTGTFVVCAHMDATGQRDSAWRADRDACEPFLITPGAEDNASGVACMLATLRALADTVRRGEVDLAFDVEFVAFSGEEAEGIEGGLIGSERYVERRLGEGTQLLAALNLDMVGSDSLGNRLQVVHNGGSKWLAELLVESARGVQPPIDLDYRLELHELPVSDHNSFWDENIAAILGVDAPVDVVRSYASYHRPLDTGADLRVEKMGEVTRAFLAALLRFDQGASDPALVFPTGVLLFLTPGHEPLEYEADGGFRLWPGSPLSASLSLQNIGAAYTAPLRLRVWVENPAGARRDVMSCDDAACFSAGGGTPPLLTGDRLDFRVDPVPILPEDTGECWLVAEVTHATAAGDSVSRFERRYVVSAQSGLLVEVRPNPVRSITTAQLVVQLERPGTLYTQVYTASGRRAAVEARQVQPRFQARETSITVPLLGADGNALPSGMYFARVQWTGPGGQREEATRRFIVVQ